MSAHLIFVLINDFTCDLFATLKKGLGQGDLSPPPFYSHGDRHFQLR